MLHIGELSNHEVPLLMLLNIQYLIRNQILSVLDLPKKGAELFVPNCGRRW